MDFNEYTFYAARTRNNLNSELLDELHMVLGIVTEAGELADMYKKHFAYGKDKDVVNIEEEIGDLMWYIANLIDMLGLDFETILEKNIAKLSKRYPEGFFSSERAIYRNLEEERKTLESYWYKQFKPAWKV